MNEFDKTTKNIVVILLVCFFVLLIFGYFIRNISFLNNAFGEVNFFVYACGLMFGVLFSILKVFLIRISLVSTLKKSKNKATITSFGHFLTRYILTGLVLFISIKSSYFDFLGTMLGVLALQPASYISGYLIKKNTDEGLINEIEKDLDI